MDSLYITLMSLEKAAKQFALEVGKTKFDFELINKAASPNELELYREELLEYNMNDCIVLWNVLYKYSELLVNYFNIDMYSCPTSASIAFKAYRTNYLLDSYKIPVTSKAIYDTLKPAYYG